MKLSCSPALLEWAENIIICCPLTNVASLSAKTVFPRYALMIILDQVVYLQLTNAY